jgi:hypothetical protein
VGRDKRSAQLGYRVEGNPSWGRFPHEHVELARQLKAGPTCRVGQVFKISELEKCGAGNRTRTYDPRITNALLYQLSYPGPVTEPAILHFFT